MSEIQVFAVKVDRLHNSSTKHRVLQEFWVMVEDRENGDKWQVVEGSISSFAIGLHICIVQERVHKGIGVEF